jgi:hypothetical protein
MRLKKLLEKNGFSEYPEQLMALKFAKELIFNGVSEEEIEELTNMILRDTGEDVKFDEEMRPIW